MFWKAKPPLDYPSVEVYKSLRQQRIDMENDVSNAEYEYALARAREFVQEQMWNGYSTFLLGRDSVTMVISDSPYEGLTKDRFGRITETNQQKVGEAIVAELVAKGYTKSRYSLWNDNYNCIRVDV